MNEERYKMLMEFHDKCARRLVEKGFAKSYLLDDTTGMASMEWTASGKKLEKLLKQLFDVPHIAARDVDGHEIMGIVGIILFGEPTQ